MGPDEIDPDGRDTNCDGADGDIERAIFVSPTGDDEAEGTPEAPVATIARGLELAADRDYVLVAEGSFEEAVTLRDGISIHGGYDPAGNWSRSPSARTTITGVAVVMRGEDLVRSG